MIGSRKRPRQWRLTPRDLRGPPCQQGRFAWAMVIRAVRVGKLQRIAFHPGTQRLSSCRGREITHRGSLIPVERAQVGIVRGLQVGTVACTGYEGRAQARNRRVEVGRELSILASAILFSACRPAGCASISPLKHGRLVGLRVLVDPGSARTARNSSGERAQISG